MKFLPSFFKRRTKIDRLKMLSDMYRFSRPEDIAKVFELGRIDVIHNVWLYSLLGFLAIIGALVGIFEVFIETKIDSIIDSRVEKEIDKRIDKFSQFYAFTQDVIPILEDDFYRIKSLVNNVQIKNNKNFEKLLKKMGHGYLVLLPEFNIMGKYTSAINNYEVFSFRIEREDTEFSSFAAFGTTEFGSRAYSYLLNKQMDSLQDFDFFEVRVSMNIVLGEEEATMRKYLDHLDNYIASLDEITLEFNVNQVSFYKKAIKRDDLKKTGENEYTYRMNWRDIF